MKASDRLKEMIAEDIATLKELIASPLASPARIRVWARILSASVEKLADELELEAKQKSNQ